MSLESFRRRLDPLDDEIARLLGERFEVCREIARYKLEHEIPMMQPHRVEAVRERYLARAEEADLPAEFAADLRANRRPAGGDRAAGLHDPGGGLCAGQPRLVQSCVCPRPARRGRTMTVCVELLSLSDRNSTQGAALP